MCVSGKLLNPEEALEVGFVDELAAANEVVAVARRWCERTIDAPARALADTRAVLRRDLVESIQSHRTDDIRLLVDQWFQPDLQTAMQELVDRLKDG